jgi:hypothetical protein
VTCQALRTDSNKLYTLTGDLHGFAVGDIVYVIGTTVDSSVCKQGVTIAVEWISKAPPIRTESGDTEHIPDLLWNAKSEERLAEAQEIAAQALKEVGEEFPHNGCAATLSALLQLARINVLMTLGAGDLAELLEEGRHWDRIGVGEQQTGDVGVTDDTGGNPGPDHIYLVVTPIRKLVVPIKKNEMVIVDNQASTMHCRSALGNPEEDHVKTDYFLRAS